MKFDDVYGLAMAVADRFGVRADNHEDILGSVLEEYPGDLSKVEDWLSEKIPSLFPALGDRPTWTQEEEWPVSPDGAPLMFVGQLNVPSGSLPPFHDDIDLFVFIDPVSGEPEIVLQEA